MKIDYYWDFNLETVKRDAKKVYENTTYDSLLHVAKILFGDRCVSHNENKIFIKDYITLEISLSWNEPKIYVYQYWDFNMMSGKDRPANANDLNYELRDMNSTFRLFGIEQMVEYLQLKELENRWIRNNEG
jgi:hypothetical protein